MNGFLGFLSDLILLTAGLVVLVLWFALLVGIAVEMYDFVTGKNKKEADDAQEDLQ